MKYGGPPKGGVLTPRTPPPLDPPLGKHDLTGADPRGGGGGGGPGCMIYQYPLLYIVQEMLRLF